MPEVREVFKRFLIDNPTILDDSFISAASIHTEDAHDTKKYIDVLGLVLYNGKNTVQSLSWIIERGNADALLTAMNAVVRMQEGLSFLQGHLIQIRERLAAEGE